MRRQMTNPSLGRQLTDDPNLNEKKHGPRCDPTNDPNLEDQPKINGGNIKALDRAEKKQNTSTRGQNNECVLNDVLSPPPSLSRSKGLARGTMSKSSYQDPNGGLGRFMGNKNNAVADPLNKNHADSEDPGSASYAVRGTTTRGRGSGRQSGSRGAQTCKSEFVLNPDNVTLDNTDKNTSFHHSSEEMQIGFRVLTKHELEPLLMLDRACLSRSLLVERLALERDLFFTTLKLLNYIAYIGCLFVALYTFYPGYDIAKQHRFLLDHFQIGQLSLDANVNSIADL